MGGWECVYDWPGGAAKYRNCKATEILCHPEGALEAHGGTLADARTCVMRGDLLPRPDTADGPTFEGIKHDLAQALGWTAEHAWAGTTWCAGAQAGQWVLTRPGPDRERRYVFDLDPLLTQPDEAIIHARASVQEGLQRNTE